MQVKPVLTQTTAADIPAGHLFTAQTAAGSGGLFIRVADSAHAQQAFEAAKGAVPDTDVPVVQLAPRSTALSWVETIPADATVSDVTDAVALTYEVAPENLRYPTLDTFTALVTGDLLLDGAQTKLVIMGPNPAIGIAFIDLETGELSLGIGQSPMLILGWTLSYSGS